MRGIKTVLKNVLIFSMVFSLLSPQFKVFAATSFTNEDGITYTITNSDEDSAAVTLSVCNDTSITEIDIESVENENDDNDDNNYDVTVIGKNAFKKCKKLKSVAIYSSVTTIKAGAFNGLSKLNSVVIDEEDLTKIEKNAFKGCKKIKTFEINATNLKTIGKNAFKGIPSSTKFVITAPKAKQKKLKALFKKAGITKIKFVNSDKEEDDEDEDEDEEDDE